MNRKSNGSERTDWSQVAVFAVAALVSYVGLWLLAARADPDVHGNIALSLLVLASVTALCIMKPLESAALFVSFQLPLYLLANTGTIGNAMSSYAGFVVAASLAVFSPRRKQRRTDVGVIALWMFAIAAVMAWVRATDHLSTLRTLMDCLAFAIILSIPARWSRRSIERIIRWFVAGTTACCAATLLLTASSGYSSYVRLGTNFGVNPAAIGYFAAFALILVACGFPRSGMASGFYAVILTSTIVLSGGRGALVAAILGGVTALVLARRYVSALAVTLAISLAVVWSVQEITSQGRDVAYLRVAQIFTEPVEDASSYRMEVWRQLLAKVPAHWVRGVGFGGVLELTEDNSARWLRGVQSHNMYLTILLEMGVVGFMAFLTWQLRYMWQATFGAMDRPLMLPLLLAILTNGFFSGLGFGSAHAILLLSAYSLRRSGSAGRTTERRVFFEGDGRRTELASGAG